jgi:hypothetical protein
MSMVKIRHPFMKFYGNDFFGGTMGWGPLERGCYLALLWACWESDDGTIASDDSTLCRITGCDRRHWIYRHRDIVLTKFQRQADGRIFNQRLLDERNAAKRLVVLTAVPSNAVPSDGVPTIDVLSNENKGCSATSSRERARVYQNPYRDLSLGSNNSRGDAASRAEGAAPPSERTGKGIPQMLAPLLKANALSHAVKPINATALSPEELAAKEAEALAFIEAMVVKPA